MFTTKLVLAALDLDKEFARGFLIHDSGAHISPLE